MPMIGLIARPYALDASAQAGESATSATYPKANGINNDFGRVARTTAATVAGSPFSLTFDLGAAKAVDCLGLLWHNLRSTDTVTFRAGSTVARSQAGSDYDSGELASITGATKRDVAPTLSKFLLTPAATQTWRYWTVRLTAVGTDHPSGYFQFSRIFIGKKAIFAIGAQKASYDAIDLNQKVTLESGEERASEDQSLIRPMISLNLRYATQTEIAEVLGNYTLGLGTSLPMLVTPDAAGAYLQDTLAFGRPQKVLNAESEVYDVWDFTATVPSLGP